MAQNCKKHIIADCLADWIDKMIPELGGVRNVKVYCCQTLPFDWFPGKRRAITFWDKIYIRNSECGNECNFDFVQLLLEELIHVRQYQRHPFSFIFRYIWRYFRYGYWNAPDEVHARKRAADLRKQYEVDDPCKCNIKTSATPSSSSDFEEGPQDDIPQGRPEFLNEDAVRECCASNRNRQETPRLLRRLRRTLGEVRGKIAAAHPCGIRFLRLSYQIEDIATGNEINRFEIKIAGYCATFVVHEVRILIQRGQRLIIKPKTMSCCYREEYESDYNTSQDIIIFEY